MKKTSIGGSALIEGLMMIGPKNAAIAVRKPDGEIILEKRPLPVKGIYAKIPIIRGAYNFFQQIVLVMKAMMFSAEFVDIEGEEEAKPSKVDAFIERVFGDKIKDAVIYFAVILSLAFSIGLFILLPNFLAELVGFSKSTFKGNVYYNLFEGGIRIVLFSGYIMLTTAMKDVKRVWQYHGAEHKTIHCYEHEEELTVENVKKYTTLHPRCGTSFMFLVMIISILVFSVLPRIDLILNILMRLALVPVVAGLSYEVIKLAGRSESKIMNIVNAPGMFFQLFTAKEPDEGMIEVAIEAFKNVLVEDKNADKW
ncbi:MAG TPA: DUF1385 domain-containing protein [Clostridia bacterium]|nr:DUF1385 domain-containing protein [Clostridia bacterium]